MMWETTKSWVVFYDYKCAKREMEIINKCSTMTGETRGDVEF